MAVNFKFKGNFSGYRGRGYNHKENGYPMYLDMPNSPFEDTREIKNNKTPRTVCVKCSIKKCLWNKEETEELGNCSRVEAWNIIPEGIEEIEVEGDMTDCLWYNGLHRRMTIGGFTNQQ